MRWLSLQSIIKRILLRRRLTEISTTTRWLCSGLKRFLFITISARFLVKLFESACVPNGRYLRKSCGKIYGEGNDSSRLGCIAIGHEKFFLCKTMKTILVTSGFLYSKRRKKIIMDAKWKNSLITIKRITVFLRLICTRCMLTRRSMKHRR